MFDNFRGERNIRRALHQIAGQRVAAVIQPGNVLVIEKSPSHTDSFEIAVRTAHIRGWVEVLWEEVPNGQVLFYGNQMRIPEKLTPQTQYRLTEGGWSVIHGTHGWIVATFLVSFTALLASVVAVVVAWPK